MDWIAVGDRKPLDGQKVLCAGPLGGISICKYDDWIGMFFNSKHMPVSAKYWMDLPKAPKEDK